VILRILRDLPAGRVECRCDMCARVFPLSRKSLDARLRRFGMVKCPTCGCVLEAA